MSNSSSDRKKYNHLTVLQRLEIVKKLEASVPPKQLAEQFGVTVHTIYSIKKNAANLVQEADKKHHIDKKAKKIKGPILQELDDKLYLWFAEQKATGNNVSDKVLQQKAEELNASFGGPSTFSCNRAWLWRFKKRHGIIHFTQVADESTDSTDADNEQTELSNVQSSATLWDDTEQFGRYLRYFSNFTILKKAV